MKLIDSFADAAKGLLKTLREKYQPTFVEQLTPFENYVFGKYKSAREGRAELFVVCKPYSEREAVIMSLTCHSGQSLRECISHNLHGSSLEPVVLARINHDRNPEEDFKSMWGRLGTINQVYDFVELKYEKVQFPEFKPKWSPMYNKPHLYLISDRKAVQLK